MNTDAFSLRDKVALIAGGGRGVGRAIATVLADAGAETAIVDRSEPDVRRVAAAISHQGHHCVPLVADISVPEQRARMFGDVLDRLQRVDILVNATAVGWPDLDDNDMPVGKAFLAATPEDWEAVTRANLTGPVAMIHLAADQMIHLGGGVILTITSAGGSHASDGFSILGASNAAAEQLTRTLAHELGRHGIRINCIALGRVVTEEQEQGRFWTAARRARIGDTIALGRVGEERDVALAALFLVSDASEYISGATLPVDGGGYLPALLETAP